MVGSAFWVVMLAQIALKPCVSFCDQPVLEISMKPLRNFGARAYRLLSQVQTI